MRRARIALAVPLVAAIVSLLVSCDSFSLLAQFRKSTAPELALAVQKSSLGQGESIALYPSGGTPPYSFGVVEGDLYYHGTLGSISNQTYTAGTAIGTIELHVTDAGGQSADATVTIIPPAPTNFTAAPGTPSKTIAMSWSYADTSIISGFQLEQSTDGITYIAISASLGPAATSYTTGTLNKNQLYYFKIYALSGSYQSLASNIATSNPSP